MEEVLKFVDKYGFNIVLEVSVLLIFVWAFKAIITKNLNKQSCIESQSFKYLYEAVTRIEKEVSALKAYFSMVSFKYRGKDDD